MEGKGNGIKTVVVNMVDVAKALNRPPTCKTTQQEAHLGMSLNVRVLQRDNIQAGGGGVGLFIIHMLLLGTRALGV